MKLRKILAGAMALIMVAGSLLVGPVETKAAESDSKTYEKVAITEDSKALVLEEGSNTCTLNAKIDGQFLNGGVTAWSWGDVYTLTGDFDVTLEFYLDAFIRGTANWDSFVMEFQGATDTMGITLRADAYGWTFGEGANVPTYAPTISWDWADYATVTDLQNVELNVKKTSDTTVQLDLLFKESTATETYVVTYPNGVPAELGFHIAGEGGDVTVYNFINNNSTTVLPENTITWSSSDSAVATVDATGKVTAVGVGTATITATYGDTTDTCAITVSDAVNPITAIDVTTDKTEIKVGNTAQLSVAYTAEKADKDITDDKTVTYKSSDDKVATVDATGKVTAVAPGKVTITASVVDGTITDTVEITVPVVPVTSIDLKVDKTDLEKGDIVNVVATVNPADTTEDKTITWTSSNEKVAKVDANGTVTAVGGGNATITATIGDVKATVKFKVTAQETVVKKTEIADLTVGAFLEKQTDGVELKKGHTYTFTFKATGSDATSTNFYETACYFIYTNSENKFNTADYKELIFARGDVWCWFNADTTQNPDKLPEGATFTRTYPENWDNWVAAMKAGAECKIIVKYDGKTITATYSVADATTVASFPVTIPSGSKLYLGLTGEKVAVTDIVVADEYVKTITGTGDVNMVLPILLVMFGGAVVIVASKKRFA